MFQSHTIFSGKWLFSTRKALANEHEVGGSCSMTMHLRTAFKNRLSRNDASVNFFTKVCLEQKYSLFDIKFFLNYLFSMWTSCRARTKIYYEACNEQRRCIDDKINTKEYFIYH